MCKFLAVVKDPGGTSAVLPVVLALRKKGHKVLLITNGWATKNLKEDHGQVAYESAQAVMDNHEVPDILITCMSSKGGVGRDLVQPLRERGVITMAIQDYPGARLWPVDEEKEWSDIQDRPDWIVVNDQISADIVLQAWPEFPQDRVVQLGYAALDKYADLNVDTLATSARGKLGITPTDKRPVILYGGQLKATGQSLMSLVKCLNAINHEVILIARPHPRMSDDAPGEFKLWNEAMEQFGTGMLITDSSACQPQEVIATAGLVTSMWSTMLGEAACLRKPTISLLLEGAGGGMEAFLASSKGGRTIIPIVELDCCKSAHTEAELEKLLLQFFTANDLGLRPRQEEVFQLDGGNAERIAGFIEGLL